MLAIGSKLGPYEIIAPLGAGGMGEVYRARDAKLQRDVAIKVLPELFAADPERLARLEREAQLLASLNHPHIGAIYGLEDSGPVKALILELVTGPTLEDRIAAGPLPWREVVPIAQQIAEALESAHERGVVHRDLKPANIKLTDSGDVKVLDFGLAKAHDPLLASAADSASPTVQMGMTREGIILGTVAYLSPERTRGRPADKRADIWAFGCVVWEMLVAERTFEGETISDTLAAILKSEIDWIRLPTDTPLELENLLARCLDRDPRTRLRDIGEARILLEGFADAALRDRGAPAGARRAELAGASSTRWWASRFGAVTLALLGLALAFWAGARFATEAPAPAPTLRYVTFGGSDREPAVAQDGRTIAFSSSRDGSSRIWLKQLSSGDEVAVTTGVDAEPRFLRDGSALLFAREENGMRSLYRVSVLGGEPRRLVKNAWSGDAAADGRLAFSRAGSQPGAISLWTASPDGGSERELAQLPGRRIEGARWSADGRRIAALDNDLITVAGAGRVLLIDADTGKISELFVAGSPLPCPPAWIRGDREILLAVPETFERIAASTSLLAISLARGTTRSMLSVPQRLEGLAVSAAGDLLLDARSVRQNLREFEIDDATGASARWLTHGPSRDRQPVYSPDGTRIAFSSDRSGQLDLWVLLPSTGALRRFTDDSGNDWDPAWSADGRRLYWSSNRSGAYEIWGANDDGTEARQVTRDGVDAENPVLTSDGVWLLYVSANPARPGIWKRKLTDGSEERIWPIPGVPELSPDGRFAIVTDRVEDTSQQRILRIADGTVVGAPFATGRRFRFAADGRGILSSDSRGPAASTIQRLAFDPVRGVYGPATELWRFDRDARVETFALSPSGDRLAISLEERTSDLLLGLGFRGLGAPR